MSFSLWGRGVWAGGELPELSCRLWHLPHVHRDQGGHRAPSRSLQHRLHPNYGGQSESHTHTHTRARAHIYISCFVNLILQWLQYQKQRMFWDESWIINYKTILFGTLVMKICGDKYIKSQILSIECAKVLRKAPRVVELLCPCVQGECTWACAARPACCTSRVSQQSAKLQTQPCARESTRNPSEDPSSQAASQSPS